MDFPAGLTFVRATGGGTATSSQVQWHFPTTLGGGGSGSFAATFLMGNSIGSSLTLPLTYTQPAQGNRCSLSGLSPAIVVPVAAKAELSLQKTASTNLVAQNESFTWTLDFSNNGNADATGVTLTDTLPAGFAFSSASGGGIYDSGSRTVTWNLGTMLHGTHGSVTIQGQATAGSGSLNNVAQIVAANSPNANASSSVEIIQQQPSLALEKTANSTVKPGGQVTYGLHYENRGNATATSAEVTDTLPAFLSPLIIVGGTVSGQTITWSLGSIPPHTSGTLTYTALVVSEPANGDPILNSAALTAANASPVTDTFPVYVYGQPTIELEKTGPTTAEAGAFITYTLSYRNTGFGTATAVTVEDALPPNCTDASTGWGVNIGGNTWRWNIGTLPPGSGGSVLISCRIQPGMANGTILVNNADINSTEAFPVHRSFSTVVRSHPQLVINKTAITPNVVAGGPLQYAIEVRNIGNGAANGVSVTDSLDPNVNFVAASQGGTESGGTVTWNIGTLEPGEGTTRILYLLVDDPLPNGSTIQNYATVTSPQTNPLTSPLSSATVSSSPILQVTKKALSGSAQAGGQITYELTVSNRGNDQATQVVVTDLLPNITQFVTATGGGSFSSESDTVTWNIGTLAAGANSTVSVTLKVNNGVSNGTPILNSVTIASLGQQPKSSQVLTPVSSQTLLTLSKRVLTKKGDASAASASVVAPGQAVTYELAFSNAGNQNASQVKVTDNLPSHFQFQTASSNGLYDPNTRAVTWAIGDLAAGQTGTVQVTGLVESSLPDGTELVNGGMINSAQTSTTAQVTTHVSSSPRLEITKASTPIGTVAAGNQVAYRLVFTNTGTDVAHSAVMVDTLPALFTSAPVFMSGDGNYDANDHTVTWDLGDIPVGGSSSRDLVMLVPNDTPDGTPIINTVALSASNANAVNAQSTNTVGSHAALRTALTVDRPTAPPGTTITYTAEIQNIGNLTATAVTVEIPVPAGTTYLSNTAGGTLVNGKLIVNVGDLPPGSGRSFLIYARTGISLPNNTQIPAVSTAKATNAPPVTANASTQILSAPLLGLNKIAQDQVQAGGLLLYSLQYRNDGSGAATQVILRDTLPPQTQLVSASANGTYSNGAVTWNLGTLAPGQGGSVLLQLRADSPLENGSTLVNKASIASLENPPVSASASTSVSSAPILQVEKIASSSPVQAGGSVLFTLRYANVGNAIARAVQLIDQLPPGGTPLVYSNGDYDSDAGTLTWSIGDLQPGESGERVVTVAFSSGLSNGLILTNGAILTASNAPTQTMQIPVLIGSKPNMRLDLVTSQSTVKACDSFEYILDIQNIGNAVAQNIPVQIPVPAHTKFVSATAGGQLVNGVVTWNVAELTPGSGLNIRMILAVDCLLPSGTQIVTTAVTTPPGGTTTTTQSVVTVENGQPRQPPIPPNPIPTLNQWGSLMLAAFLMLAAAKRRHGLSLKP